MKDVSWSGMPVQKVLEQIHKTNSDKLNARLCASRGHTNHGMWSVIYSRLCPQSMEGGKFEANFLKKLQDGPEQMLARLYINQILPKCAFGFSSSKNQV